MIEPKLCSGDGHATDVVMVGGVPIVSDVVDGCHLAECDWHDSERVSCDHDTTWTWTHTFDEYGRPVLEPLDVEGALVIADMYAGSWDDDVEEQGMAMALEVLADTIRNLVKTGAPIAAEIDRLQRTDANPQENHR